MPTISQACTRRVRLPAKALLALLLIFVAACITSIDNVEITGIFFDAAGTQPQDPNDINGNLYVGIHVDFSYNPNFFEANPPHPQDRIVTYWSLWSPDRSYRSPIGDGPFGDTTLIPDADYDLIAYAIPTGLFDTGFGISAPERVHVNNAGHRKKMTVTGPGPQDGGDSGNGPNDSGGGPPNTCPGPDGTPVACPGDSGCGGGGSDQPKDCG